MLNRWLASVERRFARYTFANLTYPLVGIMGLVFVLLLTNPGFEQALVLDRAAILRGQVWRLITFVFLPPSSSPVWILFALWGLYTMGTMLEQTWGTFRYQTFWLLGWLGSVVVAMASGLPVGNIYLLMSVLLAFGTIFPDFEFRILFVIPVKVKWLAWFDALWLLSMVGMADGWAKLFPAIAIANYLLFFYTDLVDMLRAWIARGAHARKFGAFREGTAPIARAERVPRVCKSCGVTDADPSIDFRVCTCAKCGKPTDFCVDHARNH
jgi:hypothetical protein